jgi:hypothetical protein
LPVRTLLGLAGARGRGGATFWLGEGLVGATGGTEMIGARVRVVNGGGSFTIVVCAESLREIEQTAKMRYPGSTVRITFPIEPEWFFAGGPHTGAHTRLETMEGLTEPKRPL